MGISRTAVAVAFSSIAVVATSASCLDPTQITVDMSTDVKCGDAKGTAIAGGAPGTLDVATPTTTTNDCTNGHIGTLVSTPSGSKDTDAAFLVVLGVDRPVSECTPENNFDGCIVQRRLIHYVKHTPLNLPITMWLVCKDVKCDSQSTCARSGKCVSARIESPESCATAGCFLPGEGPAPPGTDQDAGDAAIAEGGPGDAATDAPIGDAKPDGTVVIPPVPAGNELFCPPVDPGCAAGGTCCYVRPSPSTGGHCLPPGTAATCAQNEISMKCNRTKDCGGSPSRCCGHIGTAIDTAVVGAPAGPKPLVMTPLPIGQGLVTTSCSPGLCAGGEPTICIHAADDCPAGTHCGDDSGFFPSQPSPFGTCQP